MHRKALAHFKKQDKELYAAAQRTPLKERAPVRPKEHFASLARSIVGQQLSTKAAETIWRRFTTLFGKKRLTPAHLHALGDDVLRSAGLSRGKIRALRSLSSYARTNARTFSALATLPEEALRKELGNIHGIGPWTIEMFMLFTLGREDVFSPGDLGLRKGIAHLYGLAHTPTPEEAAARAAAWAPYRSVASRILWALLDEERHAHRTS